MQTHVANANTFQFHNGSIKSRKNSGIAGSGHLRFNSIMVRLKVYLNDYADRCNTFKVSIPQWFD